MNAVDGVPLPDHSLGCQTERARAGVAMLRAVPAILLIEDDPDTRAAMTEILGSAGFRVIASDEGRKALELAPATRPSVVVLDLATEGMNGWQFLERRRHEPSLARVPVVVVTGARAAPPDVDAVLRKPVSPGALLRVVRALAERARSSSRA